MKKLEIVIRPESLESLETLLEEQKANGMMITNILGYGNQKGYRQMYRGAEIVAKMLPKIKVETVVEDEKVAKIVDFIVKNLATGSYGDGKIFVYDVEDAVRIRTGERGEQGRDAASAAGRNGVLYVRQYRDDRAMCPYRSDEYHPQGKR